MIPLQLRFVLKGVHAGHGAFHEDEDDALGFRHEVRDFEASGFTDGLDAVSARAVC
jgi:hypothetical protein